MMSEGHIDKRQWKRNKVSSIDRLLSKGVDLLIVYGLYYLFYMVISGSVGSFSDEFHLRIVLIMFMFYEMIFVLLGGTTPGRKFLGICYKTRNDEIESTVVLPRSIISMGFLLISSELRVITVLFVYYMITVVSNRINPIWDYQMKPYNSKDVSNLPMRRFGILIGLYLAFIISYGYGHPIQVMYEDYVETGHDVKFYQAFIESFDRTTEYENNQQGDSINPKDLVKKALEDRQTSQKSEENEIHKDESIDIEQQKLLFNEVKDEFLKLYDDEQYEDAYYRIETEKDFDKQALRDRGLAYQIIEICYYMGDYSRASEMGEACLNMYPQDLDFYYIMMDVYYDMELHNKAFLLVHQYIENQEDEYMTDMTAADLYNYNFFYDEAILIYEAIVEEDVSYSVSTSEWEDAFHQLVNAYYSSDYYEEILEIVSTYKTRMGGLNYPYYRGMAYYELGDYKKAIEEFIVATEVQPEASFMYEELVYSCLFDQQYELAIEYADKGLKIDPEFYVLEDAKDYIKELYETRTPPYIFNYIEDNYMYFEESDDYKKLKNKLVSKNTLTDDEFIDIMQIVFGDDYFSFILFGDYYQEYLEAFESTSVSSKSLGQNTEYIDIDFFGPTTDTEVLRAMQQIEEPSETDLVIDLRTNYGGDVDSAFNILDNILPTMYLGSWDAEGEDNDYYFTSDGNHIDFNHIYIWVDSDSASSSEIVSLGLMEGLESVTLIGEQTFGKGVGQIGVENYVDQYALLVVNAYWYVQDINIHEIGIEPDIKVIEGNDDDYLNAVRSHQGYR